MNTSFGYEYVSANILGCMCASVRGVYVVWQSRACAIAIRVEMIFYYLFVPFAFMIGASWYPRIVPCNVTKFLCSVRWDVEPYFSSFAFLVISAMVGVDLVRSAPSSSV